MSKKRVSVLVLIHDSESTLELCLKSIHKIAGEIIVVDNDSKDSSREIATGYLAKIFQRPLESFGAQKQFALDQASEKWIFLLDSDEMATPELIDEIEKILSLESPWAAYKIPRKNFYFGKWLQHGGKYPDYQIRLFQKEACHFSKDIVHEKVIVDKPIGTLQNSIIHHSYPNLDVWLNKLKLFAQFRAEQLSQNGIHHSPFNSFRLCILRPWIRFIRKYIFKLGFLDGIEGLLASLHDLLTEILGFYLFIKKIK